MTFDTCTIPGTPYLIFRSYVWCPRNFPGGKPIREIRRPRKPVSVENRCRQKTGPGRPGWLPTPAPHRSGLAHHAHPVPHLMNSRPRDPLLLREHGGRSRCTYHVSLQRFMRRRLLPSPGSLGMVPPARRYYEALRLPDVPFAALRFLRLAIPSLRPSFVPDGPGHGAVDPPGVGKPGLRPAFRWRRQGLPSSRGTLVIIRHVLRPRWDQAG